MSLGPPDDFRPPLVEAGRPTPAELEALWRRTEERRLERERRGEWGALVEGARRSPSGEVVPAPGGAGTEVPGYVADRLALGRRARGCLRPVAREGRVMAAGIDSWSPCWYAESGGDLWRAMRAMARTRTRQALLLEQPVGRYRVGWFEEVGLVFAEGSPPGAGLWGARDIPQVTGDLVDRLEACGIPVSRGSAGGLRRLDVAVDVATDSPAEGLGILDCVARQAAGVGGKIAVFRGERRLESVSLRTRGGRTTARVYDKGVEAGVAAPGEWLRLEAQWRLPRQARLEPRAVTDEVLRDRFKRRFRPLWQGVEGFRLGGIETLGARLQEAIESGRLAPSRARSIAGYLVLSAVGVPQGARRTMSELERDARQLGIGMTGWGEQERVVDVATVLDECLDPAVWH